MPIKNLEHKAKALLGKHIENNLRRKKDEEDVMECIDRVNANGVECIDRVNADGVECIDRVNANGVECIDRVNADKGMECIDRVNANRCFGFGDRFGRPFLCRDLCARGARHKGCF